MLVCMLAEDRDALGCSHRFWSNAVSFSLSQTCCSAKTNKTKGIIGSTNCLIVSLQSAGLRRCKRICKLLIDRPHWQKGWLINTTCYSTSICRTCGTRARVEVMCRVWPTWSPRVCSSWICLWCALLSAWRAWLTCSSALLLRAVAARCAC